MDGSIHLDIYGEGTPLVLLPPAPHTGQFFAPMLPHLDGFQTLLVDYPGYGGSSPMPKPSIEAYAGQVAPHLPENCWLMGFHTGNLVAAEVSKHAKIAGIVMIDVPYFTPETRATYAAKMEKSARNVAFHAAFAYDPVGLSDLACPVHVIATKSNLLDNSRVAAEQMRVSLTERMDVSAPVFEAHPKEMASEIRTAIESMGTE